MLKPKKEFNIKNIPNIYLVLTVLLVNVLLIITIILISKKLPPQVPLYYGYPRGEKQLGSPTSLILPLVISSIFIALNSLFAYFIKQTFLKNTLIMGGLFAALLASVTIIKIILLTISI